MSVTLILLYFFLYFLSITAFLLVLSTASSVHGHTNFNFIAILNFYNTYTRLGFLLYLPILSLVGLPPVGAFFIKIILLVNILTNVTVLIFFLVFLCFFFNMLFYLQVFKANRSHKLVTSSLLSSFAILNNASLITGSNVSVTNKFHTSGVFSLYKYNLVYLVTLFVAFTTFAVCFNIDVFYIFLNLTTL